MWSSVEIGPSWDFLKLFLVVTFLSIIFPWLIWEEDDPYLYTPEFQYPKYDLYMQSLIEIGRFVMENWYFAYISLHEIAYFGPSDVKVRFWFSIFPYPVCLKTFYSFLFFSITTGQTKFGTARPRELKNEGRGW